MRKHRKLLIGVVALIIVGIGAFVLYHRMAQVPEPVLLLPDGDLLLYVNLKPIHFLNLSKSTQGDSEYKEFVRQTGIDWGLRVAKCESGYNPTAYNAAGPYYGVFQFLMSTFKATPYGGGNIYDPVANVNAAAWKYGQGGAGSWGCK